MTQRRFFLFLIYLSLFPFLSKNQKFKKKKARSDQFPEGFTRIPQIALTSSFLLVSWEWSVISYEAKNPLHAKHVCPGPTEG